MTKDIKNEIRSTDFVFENPMHLPLEKLYLRIINNDGREEQIKALNKFWVTDRYYPHYSSIPENDNVEDMNKWFEKANNYITALKYVLKLPFHKFWSYVLYESKIIEMLDSFLRSAVPCYLPQPSGDFEEPYTQIYNLVFEIFNKIFTPNQSETEFITPTTLGTLLNENNVITNYTLWDLCKLYGHTDDGTLGNLFLFAYEVLPNLKEELEFTVICMCEIFEAIGTAAYENDSPTENAVNNLTKLLYDTAFSINMFLKIYIPYKNVCIAQSLSSRIIHTYDSEVPILYHLMKQVYINDNHPGFEIVDNARVELLETCHNLLSYCMDMILQTQETEKEKQNWTDKYLSLITSIIESNGFLTDYNKVYPISQDMEMLTVICPNIDEKKCQLILETVKKHEVEEEKEQLEQLEEAIENGIQEINLQDEAAVPEDIVLESQITELMDMFPNYGDGFIEQCLINMNMDSQAVIMAILEENLPPNLIELDRTLPRIPPEKPEAGPSVKAAYIGKKPSEHRNFTELLNDKTHVQEQRSRFELYSSTTEDDNLYDDDYDDRYDEDYAVGVDIDDKEEILKPRRRGGVVESDDENEQHRESNEQQSTTRVNGENGLRDQFCEDPAVIRARREERYQQLRGKRGGQNTSRSKDVVGTTKGQGQEKDVLRNREKKNVNKSARGNHNRRSGAQWKRNRGMIPS